MEVDTERLKTMLQLQINQTTQEVSNLEKKISRLQGEKDRLIGSIVGIEVVERIAKEFEVPRAQAPAEATATKTAGAGHEQS